MRGLPSADSRRIFKGYLSRRTYRSRQHKGNRKGLCECECIHLEERYITVISLEYVKPEQLGCSGSILWSELGIYVLRHFSFPTMQTEPIYLLRTESSAICCNWYRIVTDEIKLKNLVSADTLVFEANHESILLWMGDYPYSLKRRYPRTLVYLSMSSGIALARWDCLVRKEAGLPDSTQRIMLCTLEHSQRYTRYCVADC